jgi:hypothetical protein
MTCGIAGLVESAVIVDWPVAGLRWDDAHDGGAYAMIIKGFQLVLSESGLGFVEVELGKEYPGEVPTSDGTQGAIGNFAERDVNCFTLNGRPGRWSGEERRRRVKEGRAHVR